MTTVERGIFDPVPLVYVGGQLVASGPDDATAGNKDLMVVDGLTVSWGREDVLEQPEPGTGRLVLFDATGTWATQADRRGVPVLVAYYGTTPDGLEHASVFFRGRIGAPVKVSRKTVVDPTTGQLVRGALVELPLQSILVDGANVVPRASWPAETMGARFDRVVAALQAAGLLLGGGTLRSFWRVPNVAPVGVKDQTAALEQLGAMFDSAGADNWTYQPNEDHVHYLPRRNYSIPTKAQLWTDGSDPHLARAGKGAYIRAVGPSGFPDGAASGLPAYLDAAALEYDPGDGITTPALITRVACTYPAEATSSTPFESTTVEVRVNREPWSASGGGPVDETVAGVRTARIDSVVADTMYATISANDTELLVRREGGQWALAPITISTARTGGFETIEAAQVLLGGFESNTIFFLQRSWLPEFGLRPIVGFMGGKIAYARGGWELEVYPAAITTPVPQHAISWSEIDDGSAAYELQWWDGDHPHGMHESVTYEDLGYVGLGLAVTTYPTSTTWDAYL